MCEGVDLLNQWEQGNIVFSKTKKISILEVFFFVIILFDLVTELPFKAQM